jgi:hypothetical protein
MRTPSVVHPRPLRRLGRSVVIAGALAFTAVLVPQAAHANISGGGNVAIGRAHSWDAAKAAAETQAAELCPGRHWQQISALPSVKDGWDVWTLTFTCV